MKERVIRTCICIFSFDKKKHRKNQLETNDVGHLQRVGANMVELVGTGKRALEMVKEPCFSEHVFFLGGGIYIYNKSTNQINQIFGKDPQMEYKQQ